MYVCIQRIYMFLHVTGIIRVHMCGRTNFPVPLACEASLLSPITLNESNIHECLQNEVKGQRVAIITYAQYIKVQKTIRPCDARSPPSKKCVLVTTS